MNFTTISLYPSFPDTLSIQWEIDNPQLNGDYKFYVFLKYNNTIIYDSKVIYNKNFHKINYLPFLSHACLTNMKLHLKCEPPRIDKKHEIDIFEKEIDLFNTYVTEQDFNIAQEIVRKEHLLFERKIGIKIKVYKRKMLGPICLHCIDSKTGTVTDSNCSYCYGTKYGFYDPIEVWAEMVETPIEKNITEIGTSEDKKAQIRITNEILVAKHDILVENNLKWDIITEPSLVKLREYPISQNFIVSAINPKSILYKGLK